MTCTGGIGHALSSRLLGCGIGAWLGTGGVAAPISCTSQSVFCCILHNFASGGKSVTPPTDHRSMSRLMFGLTKATRPPRKMRQWMRQKCVCCVAKSAPPSRLVMSVRSTIVLNVLAPTLVGPILFLSTIQMTVGVAECTDIALLCNVLCREGVQCNVVYLGGFSMRG